MASVAFAPEQEEAVSATESKAAAKPASPDNFHHNDPDALMSPARRMQHALGQEFGDAAEMAEPWPVRTTVAFVICACGAFWTAVYFAVAALAG